MAPPIPTTYIYDLVDGRRASLVKEKWHDIFRRQTLYKKDCKANSVKSRPLAIYDPDTEAIESIGIIDDDGEDWQPESFYPPVCTCEIGCWRLANGKIEDELLVKNWADMGTWLETPEGDLWSNDASPMSGSW